MTAPLRSVVTRRPARPISDEDWRDFGYLHPIDVAQTEREHAAFCQILTDAGVDVILKGPDADGQLDAIFPYDTSLMTDQGAILLRPAKALRQIETALAETTYERLGVPVIGVIKDPGTVEGGDAFWLDEQTLAIGRGYRTNGEGIRQLREMLAGIEVELYAYDLPHWRGADACLHLMSLISPVADDLAVVYLPLMPVRLVQTLNDRGWRLIETPEDEFEMMGSNVLALAPGRALMLDGNPVTRERLEAAGCEVITYQGDEVSLNRAGGPTCLTRAVWRSSAPEP
ncbi:MAG TPA: arginine deiminase family protein [Thermomicrobiales bacterium]|nr:arginine deiminase family protein [Thermomicrobiales bacterium]